LRCFALPHLAAQRAAIAAALRRLNPRAAVHETAHSNVDVRVVMGTGLFDMEKVVSRWGLVVRG
jgi:G3E family GTPase